MFGLSLNSISYLLITEALQQKVCNISKLTGNYDTYMFLQAATTFARAITYLPQVVV